MRNLPLWLLNRDYGKRKLHPFKVKVTLPEQKLVTINKNGQTLRTINVRRESRYFSGIIYYLDMYSIGYKQTLECFSITY